MSEAQWPLWFLPWGTASVQLRQRLERARGIPGREGLKDIIFYWTLVLVLGSLLCAPKKTWLLIIFIFIILMGKYGKHMQTTPSNMVFIILQWSRYVSQLMEVTFQIRCCDLKYLLCQIYPGFSPCPNCLKLPTYASEKVDEGWTCIWGVWNLVGWGIFYFYYYFWKYISYFITKHWTI